MLKLFKTSFLSLAFLAAGVVSFTACDSDSDGADTDKTTDETKSESKTDTTTTTDDQNMCARLCNPGKEGECGEGQKCYSYGCKTDAKQTDATRCGPAVGAKAIGEVCNRDSKLGTDDCVAGAFCLPDSGTSIGNGQGTCLAHCDTELGVDEALAQCKEKTQNPNSFCFDFNAHTLPICLDTCDPLAPACPVEGEACFYADVSHGFICTKPKAGSPAQGGTCANEQECQAGLGCIPKAVFGTTCTPECDNSNAVCGCCAAFCDTRESGQCEAGLVCKAFDDKLPENSKHVGVCLPA